jgi:hypothetical protein
MKPVEPVEVMASEQCKKSPLSSSKEFDNDNQANDACAQEWTAIPPVKNERSIFRYDTKRFSQSGSTWTLSDYAIGRLGDVFGLEDIIESMDKESFV